MQESVFMSVQAHKFQCRRQLSYIADTNVPDNARIDGVIDSRLYVSANDARPLGVVWHLAWRIPREGHKHVE